ncbi:capsule assembly Wzi family protein [Treponema sp. OttesenSCG-928-L16]|nr:capsule assembly Wzi family protein [Treponema sp. OttesenSCG-928-L16]
MNISERAHRAFLIFGFFLLFHAIPGMYAAPFTMISAGDPVLEDIRFLVRQGGRSFRSLTPPLSRDEVMQIMDDIDPALLNGAGREAYGRITDALNPGMRLKDGFFNLSFQVSAALEGRFRTNPDIPWTKKDNESNPVLSLPVGLYFSDVFSAYFEPFLGSDPSYYDDGDSHWGTNIPYKTDRFDLNFPLRAYIAAGGEWWNFQLGRDRLSFGAGNTGSLSISDTPDYYDFARLSLFSPNFKYSILISQMPMSISDLGIDPAVYDPAADPDTLHSTNQRYLYLHRLDFRLFKKLSIGISEAIMVGDSSLELRYLNPVSIFHSMFAWRDYGKWGKKDGDMVGSMLSLDAEWAIIPSLAAYFQFVMNEFSTQYELKNWPDTQSPRGLGFLGGLEYVRNIGGWGAAFFAEALYTDPYLYVLSSPFASYIWMRRLSDLGSKDLRYQWIGHSEGRDTIMFTLGGRLFKEKWEFDMDISFALKGEHGLSWDWQTGKGYSDQSTPNGTAEKRLRTSAEATWKPLPMLSFSLYGGFSAFFDAEHIKGHTEIGIDMGLCAIVTY